MSHSEKASAGTGGRMNAPRLNGRVLFAATLLDELTCALLVVQIPAIKSELGLSYAQTGLLMTIPGTVAIVIEPFLLTRADRGRKKRWVLAGALALACAFLSVAGAPGYLWLLMSLALLDTASGLACSVSQPLAVDLNPGRTLEVTTRWSLMGAIGDLIGPLFVAALASLFFSWRRVLALGAAAWLAYGLIVAFSRQIGKTAKTPPPMGHVGGAPLRAETTFARIGGVLREPGIVRWALLLESLTLLDEILIAFLTLYLSKRLCMGGANTAGMVVVLTSAALIHTWLFERFLLEAPRRRLLVMGSVVTLVGLAAMLGARTPGHVMLAAAALGAGAILYPVLLAEAYDAAPGRTGTVMATTALFAPLGVTMPWILGLIADRFGPAAALAAVAISPIPILIWGGKGKARTG